MSDNTQSFEQLVNSIDNIRAEYEKIRQEMVAKAKASLSTIYKSLMDRYPEVKSVSWRQYTPYFNDGDTCVFSADMGYCIINLTAPPNPNDFERGYYDEISEADFPRLDEFMKNWRKLAAALDDDVLLDLYGDHAEVTVNRDGSTTVESCDHD